MALDKNEPVTALVTVQNHTLYSEYLERELVLDIYQPDTSILNGEALSLLLINDGQDLLKMPFDGMLNDLLADGKIQPLICVGIHCGPDRKMEYGTAYATDFKGRGAKAGMYTKALFEEIMPFIRKTVGIASFRDKSFAGFSLGALSALDIVWNHASEFSRVGVFSGSLWWRRKAYEDGYDEEQDRLMHLQVRKGQFHPWLRFFLQCGQLDETADRNNNGVIDSIDDALDLIVALKAKGFTDEHIHYLELPEGKHDITTWASAFPKFLQWGWGIRLEV